MNIIKLLAINNLTISTVESMTGGALAASLVQKKGASKVFLGGQVVYSNEAKSIFLQKSIEEINNIGSVSQDMSQILALQLTKQYKSNISCGITGYASNSKFNSIAFITIIYNGKIVNSQVKFAKRSRQAIIKKTIKQTIKSIKKIIKLY